MSSTVFVLRAFSLNGEPMGDERRITALPIRIGRNGLNDLVISHGGVSSFHARIEDIEGRLCITDLGSKNGIRMGVAGGMPQALPPNQPCDLQPGAFVFFLGVHVKVQLTFDQMREPLEHRGPMSFTGHVVGNAGVLFDSHSLVPPAGMPTPPPGMPTPPPASLPPPAPPQFGGAPAFRRSSPVPPPSGFEPSVAFPGANAGVPRGVPVADGGGRAATGFLTGLTSESMALAGLRELAGSLVPGVPLESTGDIARFITKLHDALDIFCRSFIPLREGHAQFMSSFDLQRSMRRSQQRSQAYIAVDTARTAEALAAALLNPKDKSFDGPQAVENILADLMLHQLALLEGVMRGVRALLEELSPDNVESQVGGGGLPLGKHKALWNKYCELFENVSEERQAFSVIFGPEFTAAYRQYRQGGGNEGGQ